MTSAPLASSAPREQALQCLVLLGFTPLSRRYCAGQGCLAPWRWDFAMQGHYRPARTSSAHPCPEGTLNQQEGTISPRACQPCPAGRYCPGEGNGQPDGRLLLRRSYFCQPRTPEKLCLSPQWTLPRRPLLPSGDAVPGAMPPGDKEQPR
ncbi:uncharacterized protein LOC144579141 [Callithrix jacchus]